MRFESVEIQNFMSIKKEKFNLDKRGLVLIQGINKDDDNFESNGAGKSVLIESIVYALFGKTIRGLKADEVVNNKEKKNCFVKLTIEDNGVSYIVERYRKHKTKNNDVIIYKDGIDITPVGEKVKELIQEIIQMDYLTFTSSILYTARSFTFTSTTDKEMKSAFDTMLGFDLWNKCQEIAKFHRNKIDTELNKALYRQENIESTIKNLESELEILNKREKEYKENVKNKMNFLKKEQKNLQDTIAKQEYSCKSLVKNLQKLQESKEIYKKELDGFTELKNDLEELKLETRGIDHKIEQWNSNIKNIDKKIKDFNTKIQDKMVLIGSICPVCGAMVTKKNLEGVIEEINKEKGILELERKNYENNISEAINNKEQLKELYEKCLENIKEEKEIKENLDDCMDEITKLTGKLESLKTKITMNKKRCEEINKNMQELKDEAEDAYGDLILKTKKELGKAKLSLGNNEKTINKLKEDKLKYDYWVDSFGNSGIKSYLLDSVTPFLNERVNFYIQKLTSGSIEVQFNTQQRLANGELRERFNLSVLNVKGGEQYKSNSGGEQKRVDIAVNMALQDLVASRSNKKLNIAFYDEVFDALDDKGIESVVELLQEQAQEKSSIFVTSHNDTLKSFFENSITVIKSNGFSFIQE